MLGGDGWCLAERVEYLWLLIRCLLRCLIQPLEHVRYRLCWLLLHRWLESRLLRLLHKREGRGWLLGSLRRSGEYIHEVHLGRGLWLGLDCGLWLG